jgi:uncharacterized protein (DUF2235 family)
MKRIVILCDGTWNGSETANPTNVVRLARAMKPVGDDGIVQVPIYLAGVGTGQGVTRAARVSDRLLGGAFGWGLMENVIAAYRHLVFLYEPGDEIYVFGFSRGAYTARSLVGFLRSTGIIDRDRMHLLPEAEARYRKRRDPRTHPSSSHSHEFRARLSLRVVTGQSEADWRLIEGMPEAPLLRVAYLGVWDTVGALGVPRHLAVAPLLNGESYQFHDTDLSSLVGSARHAIALDERRRTFEPARWSNLDRLNGDRRGEDAPYQERFFAGDHGSVGGGGDILDLSNIALEWVAEGARAAGLSLDGQEMAQIRRVQNPHGPLRNLRVARGGVRRLAHAAQPQGSRRARQGGGAAPERPSALGGRGQGRGVPALSSRQPHPCRGGAGRDPCPEAGGGGVG